MEAKRLFINEISTYFVDKIKRANPQIYLNGKNWNYSKDIKIVLSENDKDINVSIIYIGGKKEKIDAANINNIALYFSRTSQAGNEWIDVMAQYGPWPANMIPFKIVDTIGYKIVSRIARNDEIDELSKQIITKKAEIGEALEKAGVNNYNIGNNNFGIGLVADMDIGFNILRRELGFSDKKNTNVWRRTISSTKRYAKKNTWKILDYVLNKNRNIFNIKNDIGTIKNDEYKSGLWFGRKLERFS